MTFLSSLDDGLLDVDAKMETILLHMMFLLDDSSPYLDDILHDELFYDANVAALLLLVDSNDAIHDIVHDPNSHDEVAHDATLLLNILPNGPTLLMELPQDTLDEVVQKCYIQSDVEVHNDDHSMSTRSLPDSHS